MKKVSILVPVYGVEKYIGQCATSLFKQSYANIEYIFVDDCSPDKSMEILRKVMEEHPERKNQVSILRHQHNQGLGAARLTALRAATGHYVMHVDSDDLLAEDAISRLMAKAEESNADIIDGAYAEWCGGKATNTHLPEHTSKERYLGWMLCQNITSNRIWGRLYKLSLLREHGIANVAGIDYSEDYSVVPRAMFFAKRTFIDSIVYYYRTDNTTSYTHVLSAKNLISHFRACQLVAHFFEQEDKQHTYRRQVDIGMVNAYRCATENKISFEKVDAICTYRVKDVVCRLCIALMRKGCKVSLINFLYLPYRRLIASW